jgi:hypothetical protein
MTVLPHLAARLFGVPLAIHRPKLDVILAVLGPRIGLADLAAPSGFAPPLRARATQTRRSPSSRSTARWCAAPWAWKPNRA